MPPKSKVKFTESQSIRNKAGAQVTPPASEAGQPMVQPGVKRKSKKLKQSDLPDFFEEDSYEETTRSKQDIRLVPASNFAEAPVNALIISDPDKNVSDGSASELEVPPVKWRPMTDGAAGQVEIDGVCPISEEVDSFVPSSAAMGDGCNIKMTISQKISPCMKSDNQNFSTTDYMTAAAKSFLPNLIHPINGQVSTFTRHREYTDFLRTSGCLRLFGTCILNVYRMKTWPVPEKLMEQILNSMGYQIPAKKQVEDLNNLKQSLCLKLKLLTKERCELLERLDAFQDCGVTYELLDQDEILPPRPDTSPLNIELMNESFRNMEFGDPGPDESRSTDLKVPVSKPAPVSDTLEIPYHDKRMIL